MGRNWRSKAVISLIRDTTWKCGKFERWIIRYLRRKAKKASVKELLGQFKPITESERSIFLDAVQRLAKRNIIRMERI
jgi:hypothetical protein